MLRSSHKLLEATVDIILIPLVFRFSSIAKSKLSNAYTLFNTLLVNYNGALKTQQSIRRS